MLFLIGLGLGIKDLSLLALDEIKSVDKLYLETYTAFIPTDYLVFIEKQTGKKPEPLKRKDLEDDVKHTVAEAKDRNIAILIPGDPLIATTHSIVLNEAKAQRIECQVIHAPSVFSIAIGESGLDIYKFGPTVTIPFWSERYKPKSFIDAINRNLQNGQHTLVLLDIDEEHSMPMNISEAAKIITEAGMSKGADVIVLANLGRENQVIRRAKIGTISQRLLKELEGKVLSIIVPGPLSFAEEESLRRTSGAG